MRYPFKERIRECLVINWFKICRTFYRLRGKKNGKKIRDIDLFLINWNKDFNLIVNNRLSPDEKRIDIKEIRIYDIIDIPEVNKNKNVLKEFIVRHRAAKDSHFIDEYDILRSIESICDGRGKAKNIGSIFDTDKDSYIKKININFIDFTLRYALVEYVVFLNERGESAFKEIISKDKDDYKGKHLVRYRHRSRFNVNGWRVAYPHLSKYKERELQGYYRGIKRAVNSKFAMCYESLFQKFEMENPALIRLDTDIRPVDLQYKNFWHSIGIDEKNSFYQKENYAMINFGVKLRKNYSFHMITNTHVDDPKGKRYKGIIYDQNEFKVIIRSIYLDCLLLEVNESIQEISEDYSKMSMKRITVDKKLLRFQIEKYKLGDIFEEFSLNEEMLTGITCRKLKERITITMKEFDKRMKYYSQLQKRIGEMINLRSISEQKKLNKTSRMLTLTIICLSVLALLGTIKYDKEINYLEHFLGRIYHGIIEPFKDTFFKGLK